MEGKIATVAVGVVSSTRDAELRSARTRTIKILGVLFGSNVHGFRALFPLRRLELDALVVFERAEALPGDIRIVDEQVVSTIVGSDKSKSLIITEPLH